MRAKHRLAASCTPPSWDGEPTTRSCAQTGNPTWALERASEDVQPTEHTGQGAPGHLLPICASHPRGLRTQRPLHTPCRAYGSGAQRQTRDIEPFHTSRGVIPIVTTRGCPRSPPGPGPSPRPRHGPGSTSSASAQRRWRPRRPER